MKFKNKLEPVNTKLRKGDRVVVTAGGSKGEVGIIDYIFREKNSARISGVNMGYKAVKPNPSREEQGGIKQIERPVRLPNVAIFNSQTGKADKIGYKFDENGKKLRVYKSTGEVVATEK